MKLILIRHGEAIDNVRGVLSCKEAQCSLLTTHGQEEAKAVAQTLQSTAIDALYTSPLIRTLQTAKAIAGVQQLEPVVDNRLREIDWGKYNGQPNNTELDAVRLPFVA